MATGSEGVDQEQMGLALTVARNALGRTGSNPAVGTVIYRPGTGVIATGWTQPPGQHHAEPHALHQLGPDEARGATLYVTLEPCCHHGRTPPCTDAILRAGIARVVVGTVDPFPLVSGRGIAQLRAAGLQVDVGVREAECRRMNLGFIRVVAGGLPEVTLKAAVTLDGRIASETGESKWITGPESRAAAHRLRSEHDAVLVGVGTVLADDPELTVRLGGRAGDPLRVVLDTHGRTPSGAKVLGAGCLIFSREGGNISGAARVATAVGPGGVDVVAVLEQLANRGVRRVLVEGGGRVHRSFLEAGAVDRLELFTAGKILAGGPGFVAGPGFTLAGAPRLALVSVEQVGDDVWTSWEPVREG